MKKTFKLLLIFMGSFLVIVTGALGGYLLISNNKTYYIFDVRIVEPIANNQYFVYTEAENDGSDKDSTVVKYTSMKNQKVYLTSSDENYFEIGVYARTSINTTSVDLKSSNPSVANVVTKGNRCYVYYYKEGVATISANVSGVEDSFDVYVYNSLATSLSVRDDVYYGRFAEVFENKVVAYSDMIQYEYNYIATSAFENEQDEINNSLIRIDPNSIDETIFNKVGIDAKNKKLILQCKSDLTEEKNTRIAIQSYYKADDGTIKMSNTPCYVDVKVIAYVPEFLQIELSTTPNFTNSCVFMDTEIIDENLLTSENVKSNQELFDKYSRYQKAEQYLSENDESAVYKTFFNEKVTKLYIRFRKVYTNGDIVYLNPSDIDKNPFEINFKTSDDSNKLVVASNEKFYTLSLDGSYFSTENTTFDMSLKLSDYDLNATFKFEYASVESADNVLKYYDYDSELKIFKFKYWDPRCRFDNVELDEEGNVIGFYGMIVDLSSFEWWWHMIPDTFIEYYYGRYEILDLHSMTKEEAKSELIHKLLQVDFDTKCLVVVHGYHGGTIIKNLVRKEFKSDIIQEKINLDAGRTIFLLKR